MIPDLEKVIKGLECCTKEGICSLDCPYVNTSPMADGKCITAVQADALTLLKEQEPVKPILKREGRNKYYNYYVCPRCNEEVVYDQNYCSECGAKFIWEGR